VRKAAAAVSALLVAAIFCAVIVGVARRYVFGAPLVWIDELTVVLFIWAIFWTAAFVVPLREHVAFDLVVNTLPQRGRRALHAFSFALVGVSLLAALPGVVDFIQFLWRERTPALQWRLDYVYSIFAIFIAAAAIRFLYAALKSGTDHVSFDPTDPRR
jgi:TRAP-type C4-dicarboxylate transport system permease small subunit